MLCCTRKSVECSPPGVRYTDKGNASGPQDDKFSEGGMNDDSGHSECDSNHVMSAGNETNGQLTNMDNKYKYDFIIIYNHARSHLCVTDDTKWSLDFASEASRVLENSGYHGYDLSHDDEYGRTYIERLCQVLPFCHTTIVVFTPEFVRNVLPWYLAIPSLRCHILRGDDVDKYRTLIVFLRFDSESQYWIPSEVNLAELHKVRLFQNDALRTVEWDRFLAAFSRHGAQPRTVDKTTNVSYRIGADKSLDQGQSSKGNPESSKYINIYGFDAKLGTSSWTKKGKVHGDCDSNNNRLCSSGAEDILLEQIPDLVIKAGSRSLRFGDQNSSLECLNDHARTPSLPLDGQQSEQYYNIGRVDNPSEHLDLIAGHRLQTFDAIVMQAKTSNNMAKCSTVGNLNDDCDLYKDLYPNILLSQMRGEDRDNVCSKRVFSSIDNSSSDSPRTIDFNDDEIGVYSQDNDAEYYNSDDQFMYLPKSKNRYYSGSVSTLNSSYSDNFANSASPLSIKSEPAYQQEAYPHSTDMFTTQSNYSMYAQQTYSDLASPSHSMLTDISQPNIPSSPTSLHSRVQSRSSTSPSDRRHLLGSGSPIKQHSSYVGLSARTSTPPLYIGRRYSINSDDGGYSTSRSKPSSLRARHSHFEYARLRDGSSRKTGHFTCDRLSVNPPSRFRSASDVASYTGSYYKHASRSSDYSLSSPMIYRSNSDIQAQNTLHRPPLINDPLASVHIPSTHSSSSYDTDITRQRVSSHIKRYGIGNKYTNPGRMNRHSSSSTSLNSSVISRMPYSPDVSASLSDISYSDMSSRLGDLLNENGKRQERLCQVLHMAETALERRKEHEVNAIEDQISTLHRSLTDRPGFVTNELSCREELKTSNPDSRPSYNHKYYEYGDTSDRIEYTSDEQHKEASPHMLSFSSADDSYKDAVSYLDNVSMRSSPTIFGDLSESMSDSGALYRSTSFIQLDIDNVDSSSITSMIPPSSTPRIQIRSSKLSNASPMHSDGMDMDISHQSTKHRRASQPDLLDAPNPENAIFLLQTIYHVDSNDNIDTNNTENIGVTVAKMNTYVPDCKPDTSPVSPYTMISISQANLSLTADTDDHKCKHDDHSYITDIAVANAEYTLPVNILQKEVNLSEYTVVDRNDTNSASVYNNTDHSGHKVFEQTATGEDYIVPETYHRQERDMFVPKKDIIIEDVFTSTRSEKPGINLENFTPLAANEDYIFPSQSLKQENAFSNFAPSSTHECIDTRVLHTPPPIACLQSISNIDHTVDTDFDRSDHMAVVTMEYEVRLDNQTLVDEEAITPTHREKHDISFLEVGPINDDDDTVTASIKVKPEPSFANIVCADVSSDFVIPDHISKCKSIFNLLYPKHTMNKIGKKGIHLPQTVLHLPTFSGEQYVDRKELVISSLPPETFRMERKSSVLDSSTSIDSSFERGQSLATIVLHSTPKSQTSLNDALNQSSIKNNLEVIRSLNLPVKVNTQDLDHRNTMTIGIGSQDDVNIDTSQSLSPNVLDSSIIPFETDDVCFDKNQTSNECADIYTFPDPATCENGPRDIIVTSKDHSMSPCTGEDDSGCYSVLDADDNNFTREMCAHSPSPNTTFNNSRICDKDKDIDLNETLVSHVDRNSNDTESICATEYEQDSGIDSVPNLANADPSSMIDQDAYRSATSSDFQCAMSLFRDLEKSNTSATYTKDRFVSSSLRTRLPGYKGHYFQYLNSFVGHPLHSIRDQPDGERDEHVDSAQENVAAANEVHVDVDASSSTNKALPTIAVQRYLDRTYANFSPDINKYSGSTSPAKPIRHQRSLSDIQVSSSPRVPVRARPQSASCVRQRSDSHLASLVSPPVTTDTVCRVVCHLATHPEHMYM